MGCELVRLQERDAERIGVILGLDFIGEFQNCPRQFLMLNSHTVRKSRGIQPRVVHCHSLPLRPPRLLHSPANQPFAFAPRALPSLVRRHSATILHISTTPTPTPPPFVTVPLFSTSLPCPLVTLPFPTTFPGNNNNAAPRNQKPKCSKPPNFRKDQTTKVL
jgi:hypothetical protein